MAGSTVPIAVTTVGVGADSMVVEKGIVLVS